MTLRIDSGVRRGYANEGRPIDRSHQHRPAGVVDRARGSLFADDVFEAPRARSGRAADPAARAERTLFRQLRTLLLRLVELLRGASAGGSPATGSPATATGSTGSSATPTGSAATAASPLANRNNAPLPQSAYIDAQGRWTGPRPDDFWNFNRLPGAERQNFYKLELLNASPENCYGIEDSSLLHPLPPERRIDMNSDADLEAHQFFTPYGSAVKYSPDQVRALVAAGVPMFTEQSLLITKNGQYLCNQGGIRFDFFDQLPLRAQVEMMQSIARVSPHWHQLNFLYAKLHDPATPAEIKALIDPGLARKAVDPLRPE